LRPLAEGRDSMKTNEAKVLVVDDEVSTIKLLRRMLEQSGFNSIYCTDDPTKVFDLQFEHKFHLIILDLNMPTLDGFRVLEKLQTNSQVNCPCTLVLTAESQQEYKYRALRMGANDFLPKPFDHLELIARVNNLIKVKIAHDLLADQNTVLGQTIENNTCELASAHKELYDSRIQIVRTLSRAAEYRDNETGLHIVRMSKMAAVIGRQAGMSEEKQLLLLNASPMHDIGKIGIPDNILLKPGKLTPDEWEIMKNHTKIGADILAKGDSELLCVAHQIAISHHEKYDGKGYPYGLKGENIPLVGRITALADVFDALTSVRPYKKAWPLEKTFTYIRNHTSTQFDPWLVNVFFNCIEEIIEIKELYPEPTP